MAAVRIFVLHEDSLIYDVFLDILQVQFLKKRSVNAS